MVLPNGKGTQLTEMKIYREFGLSLVLGLEY